MSDDRNVKVESIKVAIGSKSFDLTIDEAKKLKEVLDEVFGKTTELKIVEIEKYKDYRPYIWYTADSSAKFNDQRITYQDTTNQLICEC